MAQRLKRWESPRREGRNDKGRGGSARQRQKQKQLKALRQRLKQNDRPEQKPPDQQHQTNRRKGGEQGSLPFLVNGGIELQDKGIAIHFLRRIPETLKA